jgi:hypothetical protein
MKAMRTVAAVLWCTALALAALAGGSGAAALGAGPVAAPEVKIN